MWTGKAEATFLNERMESFSFITEKHDQFIPRSKIEELCSIASPPSTKSPKLTKNAANKKGQTKNHAGQQPQTFERRHLPEYPVHGFGVTDAMVMWLEVHVAHPSP